MKKSRKMLAFVLTLVMILCILPLAEVVDTYTADPLSIGGGYVSGNNYWRVGSIYWFVFNKCTVSTINPCYWNFDAEYVYEEPVSMWGSYTESMGKLSDLIYADDYLCTI